MIFCIEPNAFAGCCSVHFICYSRRNLFASLFIFFNWKVMVHRALHSNAISRLKVWMWDITTVNLKSHPEIKINGLYFNWKLQLLWVSEKSKMVVSLIEFPLEFLLPELESVSIFIFVSKYHVSIFLTIYLAGKIPFSQTNSWKNHSSSNRQKRRFCISTFHTTLAKFQKLFFWHVVDKFSPL